MSITNELRRWAYSTFAHTIFSNLEKKVDELADRIDAEHRSALEKVASMVDEPDGLGRRIAALEHLTDGMLLDESELRERVEAIERKLNHKAAVGIRHEWREDA